jgi:hypothetical protein
MVVVDMAAVVEAVEVVEVVEVAANEILSELER